MLRLKWRLILENKMLYLVMIGLSILLSAIFGNVFGGSYQPTILVADEAQNVAAADVISEIKRQGIYNVDIVAYEEGINLVAARKALILVHLEENITLYEISPSIEGYQVEGLIRKALQNREEAFKFTERFNKVLLNEGIQIQEKSVIEKKIKEALIAYREKRPAYIFSSSSFLKDENSSYDAQIFHTLGMTLFFVTYSLMFTVGDYLEDKRLKTLDRMFVAPQSRLKILLSNVIPAFSVGSFQVMVMLLIGKYLFGIAWGDSILLVISLAVVFVFTMTALSFFVMSLMDNMSQLGSFSPIVLTGMGMLGGCMWPLEIIQSRILLRLADFTPHKWAIEGIQSIMISNSWTTSAQNAFVIMVLMGFVYIILGERVLYYKALK